jgi:hypothetical protein
MHVDSVENFPYNMKAVDRSDETWKKHYFFVPKDLLLKFFCLFT